MSDKLKLYSQYALVTGGSSGMGFQYALQLAKRGYNLIVVALYQDETDKSCGQIREQYPEADVVSIGMDLSAIDAPQRLYDKVFALRPDAQVEVLINNAGLLHARHFRNLEAEQLTRIIMVHNHTMIQLCRLFLPAMLERHKGYILNVSSLAAFLPFSLLSTYASTKAFTRVFTKCLRTECKRTGVKVVTVYFGAVETNLYHLTKVQKRWAYGLGVMISAERAARVALRMMFRGSSGRMPGLVNKLAWLAAPILRPSLIAAIDRWATKKWNLK